MSTGWHPLDRALFKGINEFSVSVAATLILLCVRARVCTYHRENVLPLFCIARHHTTMKPSWHNVKFDFKNPRARAKSLCVCVFRVIVEADLYALKSLVFELVHLGNIKDCIMCCSCAFFCSLSFSIYGTVQSNVNANKRWNRTGNERQRWYSSITNP